ncbi:TSUP family transporter [Mediterraneibacter gnavus]|uniref:TSUP family transporter n=1 Tax=Mediterraneibacter gnavus TaxID=33038 RepID=UPI003A3465EB
MVLNGLLLCIISFFFGIGGGPIILVVLYFFFAMEIKIETQNSLHIILLSQISSLLITIFTHTVPTASPWTLIGKILRGILGSAVGRKINARVSSQIVDKLFMG